MLKLEIGQIVKVTKKGKAFGAIGKIVELDEDGDATAWFEDRLFGFEPWTEDHYEMLEKAEIDLDECFGCLFPVFYDGCELVI